MRRIENILSPQIGESSILDVIMKIIFPARILFLAVLIPTFLFSLLVSSLSAQGDVTAPLLADLHIEPDHVWANDNPQVITVTARFTDELSGFHDAFIVFRPETGTTQRHAVNFGEGRNEPVKGDDLDGIYVDTLTLPQHAAEGWWGIHQLSLVDRVGNRKDYLEGVAEGFPDYLRDYRFYNGESIPEPTQTLTVYIPLLLTSQAISP